MTCSANVRRLALAASVAILGARSVAAATLKVPGQHPTIASAIDLAAPGDTVRVSAGLYSEQLTIPSEKAGLRLKGVGTVVLDPTGIGFGAALTIEAPGVRIEKLTIRHARWSGEQDIEEWGNGVHVTGDAVESELHELHVLDCETIGVVVEAAGVVVKDCVFTGGQRGVLLWGDDGRVQGCRFRQVSDFGVWGSGDRAEIVKNDMYGVGTGILLHYGSDSVVEKNELSLLQMGIRVNGISVLVRKNVISDCYGTGIYVESPWGGGQTVESNRVSGALYRGLWVKGDGVVVLKNEVAAAGDGFVVEGNDVLLRQNVARGSSGDGFRLVGDRAVLIDNRATSNGVDGFDVEGGVDHELTANVARKNKGEGIENNAVGTRLQMNEARKNRVDVAMDATPALFDQNDYGSGGPETEPAVD